MSGQLQFVAPADVLWLAPLAALAVTVAAMAVLRPIAYIVDLLDRPGGHKTHNGAVPVVGGLGMLLGIVMGLSLVPGATGTFSLFLISATVLVIVGLFDDRFNVSPTTRLVAQFVAVVPMALGAGVAVRTLGDPFGLGVVAFTHGELLVTAFVTMAAINAFNMLDGLDGLAGGIALVGLFGIFLAGGHALQLPELALLGVIAGAVVGFLCFNAPVQVNRRVRCFMGDAGSTLLGFALAWLAISVSQHPGATVAPITTVWMISVPAVDLVWTVVRRVGRRQSPFRADNEHLHHLLLNSGFGVRAVFLVMVGIASIGVALGLALQGFGAPDWVSASSLVAYAVVVVTFCRHASRFARLVPSALRRNRTSISNDAARHRDLSASRD
jgi:UDP-GlcNAc:undecaprenyl-phosphate GlcNAc-1-phosphate transferase